MTVLCPIDQINESHNAPIHIPQYTILNSNVHISVLNDASQVHCEFSPFCNQLLLVYLVIIGLSKGLSDIHRPAVMMYGQ